MKKIVVLLSVVVVFLAGCSIVKYDNTDIDQVVNTVLSNKSNLYNVNFDGYKYYLPKGFSFINKDDYNALFHDKYNNQYYLYVDVVSYYHKIEKKYTEDSKAYYSKGLKYNKKSGYLEINETEDENTYFVEMMYNYAKIEAYVGEDELIDSIIQISTILNSVKYHDKILETTIGENVLNYTEETFDIFKSKKKKDTSNFLDYVEEYDQYKNENEDLIDEDNLEILEEE